MAERTEVVPRQTRPAGIICRDAPHFFFPLSMNSTCSLTVCRMEGRMSQPIKKSDRKVRLMRVYHKLQLPRNRQSTGRVVIPTGSYLRRVSFGFNLFLRVV